MGAGGGNVLLLDPTTPGSAYGARTVAGLVGGLAGGGGGGGDDLPEYDEAEAHDEGESWDGVSVVAADAARTSAFARVFLPDRSEGTYELRLRAGGYPGTIVQKRVFRPRARTWEEIDLVHQAASGETDYVAEVVQVNTGVSEPWALDSLGIFQHPIRWEVSNDGGSQWQPVVSSVSNPDSFVTFLGPNNLLRVRAVVLMGIAAVHGYTVVPWYLDSPMNRRAPIDYDPPWGISDRRDLLAAKHKPHFRLWNRYFPRKHSLVQTGLS